LLLSAHYRKQLNFTWASLGQAEEALRRLTDFLARLETVTREGSHAEIGRRAAGDVPAIRRAFDRFDQVLGVLSLRRAEDQRPPVPVEEIDRLIEDRHAARRRRDFSAADRIRDELAARGVLLEDGSGGTRWKR